MTKALRLAPLLCLLVGVSSACGDDASGTFRVDAGARDTAGDVTVADAVLEEDVQPDAVVEPDVDLDVVPDLNDEDAPGDVQPDGDDDDADVTVDGQSDVAEDIADDVQDDVAADAQDAEDADGDVGDSDAVEDVAGDVSTDASTDAQTDVQTDAPTDATADVPTDATTDAPTDATADVPTDAAADVPTDATTDAPTDAPTDADTQTDTTPDGGADSGPDADTSEPISGLDARPGNTTCLAPTRPSDEVDVQLVDAFDALTFSQPVGLLQAPGDPGYWYVVEKRGRVHRFEDIASVAASDVVLNISGEVNSSPNEAGLLGFAFHPDYATNGEVYASYNATVGGSLVSRISRFERLADSRDIDPDSEVPLFDFPQPASNHNGGHLAFGPDGYLYASFGDGGGGGDPFNHGQNPNSVYGTLLRLDVDSRARGEYGVPSDNPFVAGGGDARVYAWGLRNVWKFSFDSLTGDLWAADVGQNAWEEVNVIESGGNYGWPVYEGFNCYNFDPDCGVLLAEDPVLEYNHSQGASITGGYVYRGAAMPELYGRYIFADFSSGRFFVGADAGDGELETATLLDGGVTPSVFGEGADGELFVADYVTGVIYRLDRDSEPGAPDLPERLSETGCMDPLDPSLPGPALIPYAPNAPFWSDGADKQRWLALPDGETITVDERGDFEFPLGTVLVKDFRLDGRIVETRLFMLHPDGVWAGYSYRWNDAQTEAFLLRDGETREVGGQTWVYPSRTECNACHTAVAGRSLGLEVLQLNGEFAYPGGVLANQMHTLINIGVVDFDGDLDSWPALASPHGDAPLEDRARSYLHTNCASCHQAGGPGRGQQDYHYLAPSMNACLVEPQAGGLGLDNPQVIAPRSPARSVLLERMSRRDDAGMPTIGSTVLDEDGLALIEDFILSDFCASESLPETCDDGADNSGDGLVDCLDPACASANGCGDGGSLTCSNPGSIGLGEAVVGNTTGGDNRHEGSCGTGGAGSGPEAVFEFVAPSTGTFCVTTDGSSYDTYLHVRDACNVPATELGCNDDIVSGTLTSETEISVLSGQSVWVLVDGYDGAGSFTVEVFSGGC